MSIACQEVRLVISGETHLNFLLGKRENQAEFVVILLKIVGWVERKSLILKVFSSPTLHEHAQNMSEPNINRKFYSH